MTCVFCLLTATASGTLQDRDIFPVSDRAFYRGLVDPHIVAGLADGQILYWDGANWVGSDANEFSWDPNVLTVSYVVVLNTATIADINGLNFFDFNTAYVDGIQEGRGQWNADAGTMELGMPGGTVVLQVGQELLDRVRNVSGSTISDGTPIYLTGATGGRNTVAPADANSTNAFRVWGVMTEEIADNSNGYGTFIGIVRDINTVAFNEGDPLYLAEGGGFAAMPPEEPNVTVVMGSVRRSHATEGEINVRITTLPYLGSLSNVKIVSIADNDLIAYDSANSIYTNQTPAEAGLDAIYLLLSGSNANQTIDIGSEDLRTTGDFLVGDGSFIGVPTGVAPSIIFDAAGQDIEIVGQLGVGGDPSTYDISAIKNTPGGDVTINMENTSDTADSRARMRFFVAGPNGGDAMLTFGVFGLTTWTAGIDNDDGDSWKLSNTAVLGSGAALIADTSENIEIPNGDLTLSGGSMVYEPTELIISAASGITPLRSKHGIQSGGGAIDITANPQIAAGSAGQILILEGRSDANSVQIEDGNGVHSHGRAVLGQKDMIMFQYDAVDAEWSEVSRNFTESEKAWSFASPTGSAGTFYTGGYYLFAASDNDFNPATTHGFANISYAAHFFFVQAAGASGGVDTVVRVTGTTIDDDGNRTPGANVDISIDDAGAAGTYYETSEKWIGQVTLTKQSGPDLLANFGFCKYWDNNNNDFRIIGIEVTGRAGANDSSPNILLRHHKASGWTYNNGAAPTPPAAVVDMNTDHNTELQYRIAQNFAWKRSNLLENVNGDGSEGTIIEWFTSANKSVDIAHVLLRIRGN